MQPTTPWQEVLDTVPDALCLLEKEGRILWHNAQMGKVLGKNGEGALGKNIETILPQAIPCDVQELVFDTKTYQIRKFSLEGGEKNLWVFSDITPLKNLEQVARTMRHDLKEPLRNISTYISLVKRNLEPTLDADTTQFMAFILDGVKRMFALIEKR